MTSPLADMDTENMCEFETVRTTIGRALGVVAHLGIQLRLRLVEGETEETTPWAIIRPIGNSVKCANLTNVCTHEHILAIPKEVEHLSCAISESDTYRPWFSDVPIDSRAVRLDPRPQNYPQAQLGPETWAKLNKEGVMTVWDVALLTPEHLEQICRGQSMDRDVLSRFYEECQAS